MAILALNTSQQILHLQHRIQILIPYANDISKSLQNLDMPKEVALL